MPRRMAFYDYTDPAIAPQAASVAMSVIGGAILVFPARCSSRCWSAARCGRAGSPGIPLQRRLHPPRGPGALNGFGLWLG